MYVGGGWVSGGQVAGAVHAVMRAGGHYLAFICIVYQLFKCQAFLSEPAGPACCAPPVSPLAWQLQRSCSSDVCRLQQVPLGNCSGGGMGGVSAWNRAPGEREELTTAGFVLPFCIATWKAIVWEGLEDRVFCLFLR